MCFLLCILILDYLLRPGLTLTCSDLYLHLTLCLPNGLLHLLTVFDLWPVYGFCFLSPVIDPQPAPGLCYCLQCSAPGLLTDFASSHLCLTLSLPTDFTINLQY